MTTPIEPTMQHREAFVPAQSGPPHVVVHQGFAVAPARLGYPGEVRSPGMVLFLTWITLGLYGFYIHFKLNQEMKEFTSSVNVNPGLSALALIVPIASLVTMFGTTSRIGQTQAAVGLRVTTSGFVTFLCMFVGANWAYQQSKLNGVWQHVAAQVTPR